MANLFVDLPAPAGDGTGADQDVSGMGRVKTVSVNGTFPGGLTIEFSLDGGATWAGITTFTQQGKKKIEIAAGRMRVRRSGTVGKIPGTPNVDVASDDIGAMFVALPSTPADGTGASTSVAAIGTYNTVTVAGVFTGSVIVEISEDGVDFNDCFVFTQGGQKSKEVVAQFMRVRREGSTAVPGTAVVNVGAINDATAGGAGEAAATNCLIYQPGGGQSGPTIFATWAALIARLATLRAASNGGGCYDIGIDDSSVSPAVIPAGAYDMEGVTMIAAVPGNGPAIVEIPEGTTFTRLRKIDGPLEFSVTATVTNPIADMDAGETFEIGAGTGGTSIRSVAGAVEAIRGTLGSFTVVLGKDTGVGLIGGGSGETIGRAAFGGTLVIRAHSGSVVEEDALGVNVNSFLVYQVESSSAQINQPQSNLAGGSFFAATILFPRFTVRTGSAALNSLTENTLALIDVSGGAVAQDLPEIGLAGEHINIGMAIVVVESSGTVGLTVVPSGGDTVDGGASVAVPPGGALTFVSDGFSNWAIVADAGAGGAAGLDANYDVDRTITVDVGAVVMTNAAADGNNVLDIVKSPAGAQAGAGLDISMNLNTTGNGIGVALAGTGDAIAIALSNTAAQAMVITTTAALANPTISIVSGAGAGSVIDIQRQGSGDGISITVATSAAQGIVVTGTGCDENLLLLQQVSGSDTCDMLAINKSPAGGALGDGITITMGAQSQGAAMRIAQAGSGNGIVMNNGSLGQPAIVFDEGVDDAGFFFQQGTPSLQVVYNGSLNMEWLGFGVTRALGTFSVVPIFSLTAPSGIQTIQDITFTVNQSGTAAYQGLHIDITHVGTGSGFHRSIFVEVDGVDTFAIDDTAVAGQTRMLLFDVDNNTMERVTVGIVDSGGAGFKLLRIPN